jgi:aminopeptidase N
MPKELENNQTSTKEFIALVNENTNSDLQWFFDIYLYQNNLPILNIRETKGQKYNFVDLWWENQSFKMPLEITYNGLNGQTRRKLEIGNEPERLAFLTNSKYKLDPDSWLLFTKKKN